MPDFDAMAAQYRPHIDAAIAEDATRSSWTVRQWRDYFLGETTGIQPGYRLTSTKVMNLLGPSRGSVVLGTLQQSSPMVVTLLAPSEGGLDLGHSDSPAFLQSLVDAGTISEAERDIVVGEATVTQARHKFLGLSDPRERVIMRALV